MKKTKSFPKDLFGYYFIIFSSLILIFLINLFFSIYGYIPPEDSKNYIPSPTSEQIIASKYHVVGFILSLIILNGFFILIKKFLSKRRFSDSFSLIKLNKEKSTLDNISFYKLLAIVFLISDYFNLFVLIFFFKYSSFSTTAIFWINTIYIFSIGYISYNFCPSLFNLRDIFKIKAKIIFGLLNLYSLFFLFICIISLLQFQLLELLKLSPPPVHPIVFIIENNPNYLVKLFGFIVTVLLAPWAEEIFFRGIIYGFLRQKYNFTRAAIFSSLFFAVLHYHWFAFLPIFLIGLMLAYAYERTGSLFISFLLHVFHNLLIIKLA